MMMEGASNGGMLYHEVQESKLCAVHCVNTVLQGPFFSEFDLAALASDLDRKERQVMLPALSSADFESHNVSLDGDFSIQVLQKALEVWDLQVIPLDSPVAEPAQIDPELENAFICHLQDHWFCIRKVNGEWYNFDSLYAAPQHLSKFYLSAYLDSLKGFGWSIFLVRGNFPKEFPISSSEASNGFGQWLSPEDAERITKSCNSVQAPQQRVNENQQHYDQFLSHGEAEMLLDMEDEELRAAIAASLMDSSPIVTTAEASTPQNDYQSSKQVATTEPIPLSDQNSKQAVTTEATALNGQQSKLVEPIEAILPLNSQSNKLVAAIEADSQNDQNSKDVASTIGDNAKDENQNKEKAV
ncbi:ataxin-3 homolog [Vigna unguiculata]|uniref:ubiquitinyl hydrolase 1 n=1 Tax=Vigna unguiculata TaxID=3917 RepID=A0A4D6MUE0_VIGUN|nr:ataxin-3 homolog [Vigna unguiculata]QCE04231.1 Ataxin-3 [Vigna unguiculata]